MKEDTLLARWLVDELSESEWQQLKNSTDYPTLLRMRRQFLSLESPRTDDTRILHEILSQPKISQVKVIPIFHKKWLMIAAMIVLFLGVGYLYTATENFSAAKAQTYAFTLPDHSQVILNADSDAAFHNWNWSRNREVSLNGEAYFKVAKGKKFTVITALGTVTVMGTEFDVKARKNRFDVVCYEGKVWVGFDQQKAILTQGQSITFSKGLLAQRMTTKATAPEWMHKELFFDNETFTAVLSELERHFDISIITKVNPTQLFSGSIPGDNLDAALNIIGVTYHLKVEHSGKDVTLTPL